MDFKSILIGGLGTALLFVSIGAGVQSEPTTIQVTENPFPFEFIGYETKMERFLLNRQTGELWGVFGAFSTKESHPHYVLRDVIEQPISNNSGE